MRPRAHLSVSLMLAIACAASGSYAADTTPVQQLAHWSAAAGQPGDAARGQRFFEARHGREWSCATCHGAPPSTQGKHARTGKALAPLAPAFNTQVFTDTAKVDKWFKRNCSDVLSRECTPAEKADVLAYLLQVR